MKQKTKEFVPLTDQQFARRMQLIECLYCTIDWGAYSLDELEQFATLVYNFGLGKYEKKKPSSPNQHYEYNKAQTGDTEIDNQAQ